MGFIHGLLVLFSFIGSWFTDVRIYAFPNSGGWYDFGYLLWVASFFGGFGASSRSAEGRNPHGDAWTRPEETRFPMPL
jgi:hypothetical protein